MNKIEFTRRIFLGNTLAVLPALRNGKYPEYVFHKKENEFSPLPGKLHSYKWAPDEIIMDDGIDPGDLQRFRYIKFPLCDLLYITYLNDTANDYVVKIEECWSVFNWQLKGFPFDIIDFLDTPTISRLEKNYGYVRKIYRGMEFNLSYMNYIGMPSEDTSNV